jgi:hypothetical protein
MMGDDLLRFAANISDQPFQAICKLSQADWSEVSAHVGKLLGAGQETSTT